MASVFSVGQTLSICGSAVDIKDLEADQERDGATT